MIKIFIEKNKTCPFIFCDVCKEKIGHHAEGVGAYLPGNVKEAGQSTPVMHIHIEKCLSESVFK